MLYFDFWQFCSHIVKMCNANEFLYYYFASSFCFLQGSSGGAGPQGVTVGTVLARFFFVKLYTSMNSGTWVTSDVSCKCNEYLHSYYIIPQGSKIRKMWNLGKLHWLPQRLKSMVFEIFTNVCNGYKWACGVENKLITQIIYCN